MNKEEAIKTASKFLQRVYHDDSGIPNEDVIAIINAEANEDGDLILSALEGVLEFCRDLKEAIRKN